MKQAFSFIAPQEQQSLKKWWILAFALSASLILITIGCTYRIYSIIHEKELSLHALAASKPIPLPATKPHVTDILASVTAQLPGSVAFTKIDLEPTFLVIKGKTQDQYAWASWIEDLNTVEWISAVRVEHLQKIPTKLREYSFSIRLCF